MVVNRIISFYIENKGKKNEVFDSQFFEHVFLHVHSLQVLM